MSIQKLIVKGNRQLIPVELVEGEEALELKESFVLSGAVRGISERHEIDLTNKDLVELVFDDDTKWFCTKDTLEDIFPSATHQTRGTGGSFELPATLAADENRGIIGNVVLKTLNVFGRKTVHKGIKVFAADLEKKNLENFSGLYKVDKNFRFSKFTAGSGNQPYFIFIHGTNSSTKGSFGELMNTPLWNYLHTEYPNRVLAFQHETLTKSPLQNVSELLENLGSHSTLHLMTHSRGGLVGDILCRCSTSDENNRVFDNNEINYLKKLNRTNDLHYIEQVKRQLLNKNISVEKFIRVACPAAGTTLASSRLDHFFNISLNLLGLGTGLGLNPLYSSFKNLIAAVVDSKNDENILPGVEAMNPSSPFIEVLNSPSTAVIPTHSVAIISGNCKLAVNLKALLIIAGKLFYQHKNDLVVNTSSMYKGTRQNGAQYYFDEQADVDHFHYFKNQRTVEAIQRALQADYLAAIPGFFKIEDTPLAQLERNALLNLEGGQVFTQTVTGTKPIVILLPGIMGSNLTARDKLTWINYFRFIAGELKNLNIQAKDVVAPSLVKTSYGKLVAYLQQRYDVVTFPFDWRMQLNKVAVLLKDKIDDLLKYNQPIKVIGHSMGGVLFRDFMVTQEDTWNRLKLSAGFRLIFLGAPLGGSFRIPYVLFGKDAIIDKLSKIDIFHTRKELLALFCKYPGILSLLPLNEDPENDFSNKPVWENMRKALGDSNWPIPGETDLASFKSHRTKLQQGIAADDYTHAVYIAGRDKATPCGYRVDQTLAGPQLVFLSTAEGDQSVTWDTGIPKKLVELNQVYYVNISHGALAADSSLFAGISEILETGATSLLSRTRPIVRGDEKLFKSPETADFDLSPQGVEKTLLGISEPQIEFVSKIPLKVTIGNGDLRYSSYPLLAGHFENDGILSAEKAVDNCLGGALTERHRLGIYAGKVGTSEMLLTSPVRNANAFKGAIIAGLGEFGTLNAFQLSKTVEQAVSKYLLFINSKRFMQDGETNRGNETGISSLLIGSGYGGLSMEISIRSILEGIEKANAKLSALKEGNAKLVEQVEFVELFEDSALSCFYILKKIENDSSSALHIAVNCKTVLSLPGSKKRMPSRGSESWWWNRIYVQLQDKQGMNDGMKCLQFNASTGGAREEQRDLYSSTQVLEELVAELSTHNRWSPELARAIFELLIPNDFKDQLKKQSNINWILDKYSASFPWELLQDSTTNALPLCINAGMIRQLATKDFRLRITPVVKDTALVIADPLLKGFLPQLEGAKAEGKMVEQAFRENNLETTSLVQAEGAGIIQALFCEDYKLVHLAGHGLFNEKFPDRSGMVIGDNIFISTREIAQMGSVPEMVFVNCCFLGKTDAVAEAYYQGRFKLAANIGTQLIENGVKAVVVAGWAIDDAAALDFTEVFYKHMFNGENFGNAVLKARRFVYHKYKNANNTWGAYQCYGDAFYRFREVQSVQMAYEPVFVISEEAEIELYNLGNEINTGSYAHQDFLSRIKAISDAVEKAGIRTPAITEAEAMIYTDLYEFNFAIARFESLLAMEDASFSVKVLEQYCNIRAKKYVHDFFKGYSTLKQLNPLMEDVLHGLQQLITISPTSERYSLLGSTYKRKAVLSAGIQEKYKSYAEAAAYYHTAYSINKSIYAFSNWIQMENILVLSGKRKWGQSIKWKYGLNYQLPAIAEVITTLMSMKEEIKTKASLDYFTLSSLATIQVSLLMIGSPVTKNNPVWEDIEHLFASTWEHAGTRAKKLAETEQLELIIHALENNTKRNAVSLKKMLQSLKDKLEKIL